MQRTQTLRTGGTIAANVWRDGVSFDGFLHRRVPKTL